MAGAHLQRCYAARFVELPDMEGCQPLQTATKVRENDPALSRRGNGTYNQVMPGLDDVVAQDEEATFPRLFTGNGVQVIDTHEVPGIEALQQRRPGSRQLRKR